MKYNRSEIMKNAHRTYKYVGRKQGKTFGEVLKATWRLAKVYAAMEERAAAEAAKRDAEHKEWLEYRAANPVQSGDYKGYISHVALYGREFVSGGYCGD